MSYFRLLGFSREPFSTSPDPDFFYDSPGHHAALIKLMIEIRLRRGLSVIMGDVGTGKTTLSRKFFHMLGERRDIVFGMILDPLYESEELFLLSLLRTFHINLRPGEKTVLDYREAVKKFLFEVGVEQGKTVVLLIDESQKLTDTSLECLRILLNYETNEYKLLQLVILGQLELLPRIKAMYNLYDRISMTHILNPLDLRGTREMIEFRLKAAGYRLGLELFSDDAIAEIFALTQGYPRRISMICHNALKKMVAEERKLIDAAMIEELFDADTQARMVAL